MERLWKASQTLHHPDVAEFPFLLSCASTPLQLQGQDSLPWNVNIWIWGDPRAHRHWQHFVYSCRTGRKTKPARPEKLLWKPLTSQPQRVFRVGRNPGTASLSPIGSQQILHGARYTEIRTQSWLTRKGEKKAPGTQQWLQIPPLSRTSEVWLP